MTTFDDNLARLDAIAGRLEGSELPLDEALALFEEGIAQLRAAAAELARAEARVKVLVESAGGVFELTDLRG